MSSEKNPGFVVPEGAKRNVILDRCTQTDARKESQYLAFGVVLMQAERFAPN